MIRQQFARKAVSRGIILTEARAARARLDVRVDAQTLRGHVNSAITGSIRI